MNIIDILTELDIPFRTDNEHEHCRPGWVQIDCPNCQALNHFRLGIFIAEPGRCNCWACGPIRLWEALSASTSSNQVSQLLKGIETTNTPLPKHTGKLSLPRGLGPLTSAHRKYLRSRNFEPDEIVRLWQVQGLGHNAGIYRIGQDGHRYWKDLSWRLFIPITVNGEMVSWTTRSIAANTRIKRYSTALNVESKLPWGSVLYGEDFARHAISVHEGSIDAWAVGPGATSIMGLSYTQAQVERIARYPVRGICFDNEEEAQKRARKLMNELQAYPGETFNLRLEAKDTAEASRKELKEIRQFLNL